MKIIVCIKRVVDTETRVKIGPDGKSIDLGGVQFITAPYDEMAVEKAIQLRDGAGEGSVTVMTVGPAAAAKELRTALAMGADDAVHVVHSFYTDANRNIRATYRTTGKALVLTTATTTAATTPSFGQLCSSEILPKSQRTADCAGSGGMSDCTSVVAAAAVMVTMTPTRMSETGSISPRRWASA